MGQVRFIAPGDPYTVQPGERLMQLENTGDVPLYVGIRNGEYMIAAAAGDPVVTYVLTQEQYVRLQQQLQLQPTYKSWIASGLLTLTELQEVPVTETPPPPEPEPEDDEDECEPPQQDVLVEPTSSEPPPPPDESA